MSMSPPFTASWRDGKTDDVRGIGTDCGRRAGGEGKVSARLNVCVAAGCLSLHSDAIKTSLEKEVQRTGANCRVAGTGCMGLCSAGLWSVANPMAISLRAWPKPSGNRNCGRLDGAIPERLLCSREQPFFQRQTNVVLENSGRIDPEKIAEYIAADGYRALVHALTEMLPAQIVQEVSRAGCAAVGERAIPPA